MPKKGKLQNVLRVRVEVIRCEMKIVFLRNSFNAKYWKENSVDRTEFKKHRQKLMFGLLASNFGINYSNAGWGYPCPKQI